MSDFDEKFEVLLINSIKPFEELFGIYSRLINEDYLESFPCMTIELSQDEYDGILLGQQLFLEGISSLYKLLDYVDIIWQGILRDYIDTSHGFLDYLSLVTRESSSLVIYAPSSCFLMQQIENIQVMCVLILDALYDIERGIFL